MQFTEQRQTEHNNSQKLNQLDQSSFQVQSHWEEFFQETIANPMTKQKNNLLDFIWKNQQCLEEEQSQHNHHNQITSQSQTKKSQERKFEQKYMEIKSINSLKNNISITHKKRNSQKIQQQSKALRLFIKSKLNFQRTYGQKLQFDDSKNLEDYIQKNNKNQKGISTLKQELIFSRYNMYQKKSKFIFIQGNLKNDPKNNYKLQTKNQNGFKIPLKLNDSKFSQFQNQIYSSIGVKSSYSTQKFTGSDKNTKNLIVSKIYGQKRRKATKKSIQISEKKVNKDKNYIVQLQNQQNKIITKSNEINIQKNQKCCLLNPNLLKRDSASQNFKRSSQYLTKRKKQFKNPVLIKSQTQKQCIRGKSVQCQRKSIQKIIIQNFTKEKIKTQQNFQQLKLETICSTKLKRQDKFQSTNQEGIKVIKQEGIKVIKQERIKVTKQEGIKVIKSEKNENKQQQNENLQCKIQKLQEKSKFKYQKQSKDYFQAMQRYNVKLGHSPSTFLLIFDSRDNKYIVKNLLKNNWKLNKKNNSQFFILKWVYLPSSMDLKHLKNGQFYNHFKNIHQITSKAYLSKNLTANIYRFRNISKYFPISFDIGKKCQNLQFVKQFRQNVVLILLKRLFLVCYQNQPQLVHSLFAEFSQQSMQCLINDKQFEFPLQDKSFNVLDFQNFKEKHQQFILNINAIISVLKFCRFQRKNSQLDEIKVFHFLNWSQYQFNASYDILDAYSQEQQLTIPNPEKNLLKQFYSTPSQLLIKIIVKQFVYFNKRKNWLIDQQDFYKAGLNNQNIWIVKPGSNARGNGIYLQKDLKLILSSVKGIQSRIVQKYIQRPLLLKKSCNSFLNNKKFDFRQWVLLKSLDPLQIYMFSHCYIRLQSIKNFKSHLTNYSLNKGAFQNIDKSVLGIQQFQVELKQQYGVDWNQTIKPKITQIIIQSILSCQQKIENSENGTCFQLLGYDILIDENFNPWLIQVNMSPACQERTNQLSQYLQGMNKQLLNIVFSAQYIPNLRLQENRKYKWQKIYFENYQFVKREADLKLQIVGSGFFQNTKNKANDHKNSNHSPNKIQSKTLSFKNQKIKHESKIKLNSLQKLEKNEIINQDDFDKEQYRLQQIREEQTNNEYLSHECIEESNEPFEQPSIIDEDLFLKEEQQRNSSQYMRLKSCLNLKDSS